MKLLYPTSLVLDVQSLQGFSVDLQPYDVSKEIPAEHLDATVLVTWTNSPANLKHAAANMPSLKWIQSLAAGPNDVLSAGFDPKRVAITTGSGLHDATVAEHALGLLLASARKFHQMRDSQTQGKWPGHLGGPQPDRPKGAFTTLRDANVLIWGFGNIAKTLAPYLTALGARVTGVARQPGVRDGIQVHADADLPTLLPQTDALVMILPGSDATKHALNAARIAQLPRHAWVVNVGRGTSIDEAALDAALTEGRLGGAALDVFETEPLPGSSPLYAQRDVILSPHAAGGRPQGAEALVAENLRRFIAGQALRNVI